MFRTIVALTVLLLTVPVSLAAAADDTIIVTAQAATVAPGGLSTAHSRPPLLPVLYASYGALQVFDVYSTNRALSRGAREANPLMQPIVGNQSAFWAIKASATAGTIIAAERLWKKDKKAAAITLLVVSNSVAAIVAARNASMLRRQR